MARWTVERGGARVDIDVNGSEITIDVPSGVPFTADIETAEEFRLKLGAAIGAARHPETSA